MSLSSKIESILFVASKPLALKSIAKACEKSEGEVEEVISNLVMKFNQSESGINIIFEAGKVQMVTNSSNAEAVDQFIKDEISGELTRAQLETLTVIAYRGPITRPELEQIRGVNCSLIIRNLSIRGLVEEKEEVDALLPSYTLSTTALRELGITTVSELPDYDTLHKHENIERVLEE